MDYSQFPLAKPTRKRKATHSRKKRTVSRRKMVLALDAIARQEVFERDGNVCVRCKDSTRAVQWCHIFSRRHLNLRWEPDNALTMCAGCHLWWHHEPILATDWFRKNWQGRYIGLMSVSIINPKVNVNDLYEQRQKQ